MLFTNKNGKPLYIQAEEQEGKAMDTQGGGAKAKATEEVKAEDEGRRRRKEQNDRTTAQESKQPKGLPHRQVPQPYDLSADALDKQLPPTQA